MGGVLCACFLATSCLAFSSVTTDGALHGNTGGAGGAVSADKSELVVKGSASYTNNSAGSNGGAMRLRASNFSITGSKIFGADLPHNQGEAHSDAGDAYTSSWRVAFVENSARNLGGAIMMEKCNLVHVHGTIFKNNKAALGGAVYVLAVDEKQTHFKGCAFSGNRAGDGGAVYLYTGPGVDIFTTTIFRNNFAHTSGGAIFHTGSMRVFNTSLVANKAGIEGAAVMSIGVLEELSNVLFSENAYFCRAGEYGYIIKDETDSCMECFDEVCSRCSIVREGVRSSTEEVRINGKPVCYEPPPGATALSSGTTVATLALNNGYFRTSNQSHEVRKCYGKNACHGGTDTDKYCAPGYTGPYCAVCAEGYVPGIAYSCRECSGDIQISAVSVGLVVLLLITVLLSYLGKVVHDGAQTDRDIDLCLLKQSCWSCQASLVKTIPLTSVKIVVTVWQIISQFDAIAGDVYPELYQNFISKLSLINLDFDLVLSYSCFVTNDFYDRLLVATITPLFILVVLAGSYFIGKKRNSGFEAAMRYVWRKHQAVVLYVAFFVYSPVSFMIFKTFNCDELDDGDTYLRADYSISCLTSRHRLYEVYALIMVGIFPVGIAAVFASLLFSHRRDLVKSDRKTLVPLQPLRSLWVAYKPSHYYFEVLECGRRISLTGIAAFVLPNSTAQVSIALLFAVVFVFVSEALSPFEKRGDMGLYRWGNGIIVASMYVAFLGKVDIDRDTTYALLTFSGVVIAANVFMVVSVFLQTALLFKEWRRIKREVQMIGPGRRTYSAFVRDENSLNEGGEYWEENAALEFKDSDA